MAEEQKERETPSRARSVEKIENALFELLLTRKYSDISVIEICAAAGVARKTFYRNYESKTQVVERKADKVFAEFSKRFGADTVDSRSIYLYLYEFVMTDKTLAAALTDNEVCEILVGKIIEYFEIVLETTYHNSVSFDPMLSEYYMRFFAVGLESLIRSWIKGGCKTPPKTMAALTERLMYGVMHMTS